MILLPAAAAQDKPEFWLNIGKEFTQIKSYDKAEEAYQSNWHSLLFPKTVANYLIPFS